MNDTIFKVLVLKLLLLIARKIAIGCQLGTSTYDEALLAQAHREILSAEDNI